MQTFDEETFFQNAVIKPPTKIDDNKRYTRIVVDSKDRDMTIYAEPNKYEITLYDDIEDIITAQLLSSSIPLSGYIINSNHNTLAFKIGSTVYNAVLDDGDYTASELASALQTKMTAASGVAFTVAYSDKTGKLTISTVATNFTLTIGASSNTTSLGKVLGFVMAKDYVSTSYKVIAPAKVNLEYFKYIVMDIDGFDINKSGNFYNNRGSVNHNIKIESLGLSKLQDK